MTLLTFRDSYKWTILYCNERRSCRFQLYMLCHAWNSQIKNLTEGTQTGRSFRCFSLQADSFDLKVYHWLLKRYLVVFCGRVLWDYVTSLQIMRVLSRQSRVQVLRSWQCFWENFQNSAKTVLRGGSRSKVWVVGKVFFQISSAIGNDDCSSTFSPKARETWSRESTYQQHSAY